MARYITGTLPARIVVDGVGGGDVVFRELTLGEYLDLDKADRLSAALFSFRGAKLPIGADREEWIRNLPGPATDVLNGAVVRLHSATPQQRKAFHASHVVDGGEHRWTLPFAGEDLGGVITMRELRFGQIEDVLASARASKASSAVACLAAAACGVTAKAVLDMPCRRGTLVLGAYSEIHNTTVEEDESFFGGLVESTAPPKTI